MDSLTQIVLGAAVGEAVLGRKVGNKAMLYGAIAGTIPDLDALAGVFTDTITAIEVHRGFSHSIIFSILAAPFFGFLISRMEKVATWKDWSWLMFWGLFTHPLLDSFTTWGTQLFWPLDIRLAFKSIFVIDPLYTLPFIVFVILAMRRKKEDPKRVKYNKLGLLISSGYLVLSLIFKGIAFGNFRQSLEKQGIFYERMDTRPTPFNIILWTANIETEDAYLVGYYSFFDDELVRFPAYPKHHEYLGRLKNDKNVQRLIDISNGWYTISEKTVIFTLTICAWKTGHFRSSSNFVFSYKLISENGTIRAEEVSKRPDEGAKLVRELWRG